MSYKFFHGKNTRQNGPAARRAPSPEVLEDTDDDFYIQAGDLLDPRPASPVQQRSSLPNIISPSVQPGPTAPRLLSPPTQRASGPELLAPLRNDASAIRSVNEDVRALMDPEPEIELSPHCVKKSEGSIRKAMNIE